jgi:hypothetical protein
VSFALGERVPFELYPMPSRPAGPLPSFEGILPAGCTERLCPGAIIIRSDPADPNRPVRRVIDWRPVAEVHLAFQAPGRLRVRVNGATVAVGEWWSYVAGGVGVPGQADGEWTDWPLRGPRPGERVTVEISPEHLRGRWQVVLAPPGSVPG